MRAGWIVALLPAFAVPDLLPPGHKDVRHELILLWDATALPQKFVASPMRGFHGNVTIRPGEPFPFSSKYGTRIVAAPPGADLPPPAERLADVPWPSAPVPVREVRSIGAGHPLARVETTFRITAVENDTIRFERVAEHRFDAAGRELGDLDWLPLCLIAAGGAFWLWRLDRAGRTPGAGPA